MRVAAGMVVASAIGSPMACSKPGQVATQRPADWRTVCKAATKPAASKVHGAPRRANAATGSGNCARCALVRWNPSIPSATAVPAPCAAFRCVAHCAANVVLPAPGTPTNPINRRVLGVLSAVPKKSSGWASTGGIAVPPHCRYPLSYAISGDVAMAAALLFVDDDI